MNFMNDDLSCLKHLDPNLAREYYGCNNLDNYKCRTPLDSNCVEFWAPISDRAIPNIFPGRYWISTYGRTWNISTNRPFGLSMHRKGYLQYSGFSIIDPETGRSTGKFITRKLHRIIMCTFAYFPGCEKFEINHIDGCKTNNMITNLEWCTSSENTIHAINNGLKTVFGNNYKVILTDEDVALIRSLKDTMSYDEIWTKYGFKAKGASYEEIRGVGEGFNRIAFTNKDERYSGLA